jgi:hypothetical protein
MLEPLHRFARKMPTGQRFGTTLKGRQQIVDYLSDLPTRILAPVRRAHRKCLSA